jgi:hypothetical protein
MIRIPSPSASHMFSHKDEWSFLGCGNASFRRDSDVWEQAKDLISYRWKKQLIIEIASGTNDRRIKSFKKNDKGIPRNTNYSSAQVQMLCLEICQERGWL